MRKMHQYAQFPSMKVKTNFWEEAIDPPNMSQTLPPGSLTPLDRPPTFPNVDLRIC